MIGSHALLRHPLALVALALALGVLAAGLLGVPTAGADPTPPPRTAATSAGPPTVAIAIQPFGTKAIAKVTTSLPAVLTFSTKAVGAAQATAVPSPAGYATAHEYTLPGLSSNTRHELTVVATTQEGQTATATTGFTTLKQRVRVTLREINVTDDGDWLGDGDPLWLIGLDWKRVDGDGVVGACFPLAAGAICEAGSYSEGRYFPRTSAGQFLAWTFAEENFDGFPYEFHLFVEAQEWDFIPVVGALADFLQECRPPGLGGCPFQAYADTSRWAPPQDVEWASASASLDADDRIGGLHSRLIFTYELFHDNLSYPSARNAPSSTWR